MATKQFLLFLDGIPAKLLSEEQTRTELGLPAPVVTPPVVDVAPPVPKPLYGAPRTLEGTTGQNDKVYSLTGYPYLLVQGKDSPDTFWLRPTNLTYALAHGRVRLNTANNPANPNVLPNAPARIDGYETLYFDAAKKEPYYRQAAGSATGTDTARTSFSTTHVDLISNVTQ